MLEMLPAPDTVVAMRMTGRIDRADIERAIEAVDAALARHERISFYAEADIAGMTPGALARDIGYGLGMLRELHRVPRAALVTSQDWMRRIARVEQAILPGIEIRAFTPAEREAALAWVSGPLPVVAEEREPAGPSVRTIATTKPDVVAFEVDGRIGADDTRRLVATFGRSLDAHERLRVLARLRRFDGITLAALREEGLFAMKLRAWRQVDRYALVGGPSWLSAMTRGMAPFVGVATRHFPPEDEAKAWVWLGAEPLPEEAQTAPQQP